MNAITSTLFPVLNGRIPGQLVIQFTDRCNAKCPQCGMRVTEDFPRSTLQTDVVKKMLDAAAQKGVQAVSFTGGEPLLYLDRLVEMIRHAGKAGIPYIRTGTNGFVFKNPEKQGFRRRIRTLAEKLAETPLRNFWISIDSAEASTHEKMRGFSGVVAGIEKALPVFHAHGLYPSANLGVNRNVGGKSTGRLHPLDFRNDAAYDRAFYTAFRKALHRFYQSVIDLGFTMANTCYPMSIGESEVSEGLNPVYAATAIGDVVRFSTREKALLFKALLDTVPNFRSRIRVFSPMCNLYTLYRHYAQNGACGAYPCRGGIDFFFVDAKDGGTYPCGYRGNENQGKFWDFDPRSVKGRKGCDLCDWECFRDPSELFGPILETLRHPVAAIQKMRGDSVYFGLWVSDLKYYNACSFFNSRIAPDYRRLKPFENRAPLPD